jgi:hypothetical protein
MRPIVFISKNIFEALFNFGVRALYNINETLQGEKMKGTRSKLKPRECPSCGSTRIADIMYGLPAFDQKMQRDIEEGKIVLGGCCIAPDSPVWKCLDCGLDMGSDLEFFKIDDEEQEQESGCSA